MRISQATQEAPKAMIREYIEERVERIPFSGCWIWMRSRQKQGYGDFRMNKRHHLAHRASYEEFVGPIPAGMHVLHRCDVRSCCNPAHLFVGTNRDNIADAVAKGRKKLPGERNGRHLLTEEEVRQIRIMCDKKELSRSEIGKLYEVSKACIAAIATRRNWGYLCSE